MAERPQWTVPVGPAVPAEWSPTRALGRSVVIVGVCVLLGVVFGRLDLIAIAAPFAVGTAWSLRRRPTVAPEVSIAVVDDPVAEGDAIHAVLTVANPGAVALDTAVARVLFPRWLEMVGGDRPFATGVMPGSATRVALSGTALRWGYHPVGPSLVYAVAADGLLLCERAGPDPVDLRVLPQRPVFRADDDMPVSSALVGVHRSRRPGQGGELAGVRRYGPGDRLRRVDWRVTLRTNELHVAHTLSDRDAEVVIVLDVVNEAGRSGGIRGAASVVDTSVRAAAGIAEYYLRQGDRVSLIEYSGYRRLLRAASGRKHLQTIVEWLLATRVAAGSSDVPPLGLGAHLIPVSALTVVLSPLLNPRSVEMIAALAHAGRTVIVVDTLGALADRRVVGAGWTATANHLWRLERDNLIGQLREAGVPVAPWAGAGTLDAMLRDMVFMAHAPRIGTR